MDTEVAHTALSELHLTETMQERQQKMADLSDAFIVLPGGLGTLAEFFEIITWRHLGIHDKPVFVLNTFGYWNALLEMLNKAGNERFLYKDPADLFIVAEDLHDIEKQL